jgi:hypothetical protein
VASVNLAARFVLELCMLAALAFWGAGAGSGIALHALLAIAAPVSVAAVWGLAISPRARFRLGRTAWVVVQLILFGVTAVALVAAGHVLLALAFVIAATLNLSLLLAFTARGV